MYRPLQLFIGLRYTRAKRRNHFISFISLTSMLGIALGVTALITVLSVMNGFETELRQRILGMTSHATISGYGQPLTRWQALSDIADTHPEVSGSAPYIQKEGMLVHGQEVNGSILRGILPQQEPKVSSVGEDMLHGSLDDLQSGEFRIILGVDLARILGVMPGDKVTLVTPSANVTPAGVTPRMKRFTVSGIFEVGMYEYDSAMALIHLDDARRLFRMEDEVTGLRLKLDDMFRAPLVSRELAERLPGIYQVRDWTQYHANFFRAIKTEKTVMFVILLLIVAVAAFNIVSTLVMVVTDKTTDIAILRTLGATPRSILGIFMVQGTVIGFIGTVLGLAGGVALALNVETIVPAIEQLLGQKFLPADVYYISDLPSELHWEDVAKITAVSFLISVVATIYPALRASRTQPAESLRYE
ncbi:MAG: lipoprotein-releasing ABC transporter permease subunit [Gammaproteobacteria bacterium]|nr:lipoprotein-releasing ABC transporter permease subunit [Gammaproteobacteria bacterium]MCW8840404.1 lipoprotein-releasing ABC transporter permease subunit [Gammaproteobacteria bacterium]MCW8927839.1 lipoprotein-releasing ABC transporter permease subunit [Gammaproteobacteria bacterium]MCW8957595.1 lipoprotein-releasing ABC transporter permease subunit [Gammaproteobacteria bacterium]MCW8973645.1 lipoprotein-releasing ABC transporter permease subunit [Gammaproteobacteria bacterium]